MTACDAHVAPHGQPQRKFNDALQTFLRITPPSRLAEIIHPTWKNIYDRLKKQVSDHKTSDKRNTAASDICGKFQESTVLLDDIAQRINDTAEEHRAERQQQSKADERLMAAGEAIR